MSEAKTRNQSNSSNGPLTVFDESGDTAIATVMIPGLKTLDDLLRHMKVDLDVWEVERHVINKYEVAMREPATTVGGAGDKALIVEGENGSKSTLWTRGSNVPVIQPLFQIKAWLRRKTPQERGLESLIKRLEAAAPVLPKIKRPAPAKLSNLRTLEVCIMDPHIGLLCNYPEADGPWDLELAAGCIMQALDDLIERASVFGPFVEVVMPFGNDFTHADNLIGTTTAGTPQPESIAWFKVFDFAEAVAIKMVERLRRVAPVSIYEIGGNHSQITDFALSRVVRAYFHRDKDVTVDASASPYKFHRAGVNLIGFDHCHHVKPIRMAGLMANERRDDWHVTEYREWHCGDQHRKGSPTITFEEQGVSVEYVPGITAPNEWHRLKSFSHQKRGAMAYVWDHKAGPIARFQHNISQYHHKPL